MKKRALARRLARQLRIPTGDAADRIDRVVHEIVRELKDGHAVELPGFGTLEPDSRSAPPPRNTSLASRAASTKERRRGRK